MDPTRSTVTASNLEKAQLTNWLAKRKTVEDVFKLLKLDGEGSKLFNNPVFSTWIKYAETSSKNSEESMASMVRVLRAHCKDEILVHLIAAGKTSSPPFDVKILSGNLEKMLMEKWMSSGQSEAQVFQLMGLKSTPVDDLLESPMFSMWMTYVAKMMSRHNDDRRVIYVLEDNYNVLDLAMALASAKSANQSWQVQSFARNLQLHQFAKWKRAGWGPDRIKFTASVRLSEPKLEQVLVDYTTFYKITTIMTRR